jgi:hypothetical protein
MTAGKSNLPASVAARLLNRAKQTGDVYQTLLTSFCFERLLYRLGRPDVRERFVLKGAMLLRVWSDQPYRATRDLDLLRTGDGSFEAIRADIRTICAVPVEPDAVSFDADAVEVEAIRAEDEYAGTRATLPARCGTARLSLQIDMGLGDSVWPAPRACAYPALLDFPAPEVLAYPREAVVAGSSKRWSSWATATAASRTSSTSTTWRADSSSTARPWRRPWGEPSHGAGRPSRWSHRSGSLRATGTIPRDPRRYAPAPAARGSRSAAIPRAISRAC